VKLKFPTKDVSFTLLIAQTSFSLWRLVAMCVLSLLIVHGLLRIRKRKRSWRNMKIFTFFSLSIVRNINNFKWHQQQQQQRQEANYY